MSSTEPKYEFREVRAMRGFEKKTIAKWEADGWEFVSENQGKVQSKLNFRRPKPKLPVKFIAIGAAVAVVLAGIITVGALTEGDKKGDAVAIPTPSHSSVAPSASPTETSEEILTVENNADFAKFLADTSGNPDLYQSFFDKYKGRTIAFDGNVAFMAPFKNYKYTFDVLLYAGDYDENTAIGPPFRVEHVVTPLGWKSTNPEDYIGLRSNLKIVAELYDYNPLGQTFRLQLVSTTVR